MTSDNNVPINTHDAQIVGGVCSLDPDYQYLFVLSGDQVISRRWLIGYPEKFIEKRGAAFSFSDICREIVASVPEANPPFIPSSIQIQLETDGGKKLFYDTHPPHELSFKLLQELRNLHK